MITGTLVMLATAVAVAAWGLLLADRASRALEAREEAADHGPPPPASRRAFEPMNLAASPLRWPSERAAPPAAAFALQWPSASWGADWKKMAPHAGVAPEAAAEVAPERAPIRPAVAPEAEGDAPRPRPRPRNKDEIRPRPTPAAAAEPQPPAAPVAKRAPAQHPDAAPVSVGAIDPAAAKIREMVRSQGLASAVDSIRRERQVDFQVAAQIVARALRA